MKTCVVLIGSALISVGLMSGDARAQAIAGFGQGVTAERGIAGAGEGALPLTPLSDLIFDSGFDGRHNGGTSCATATMLAADRTYTSDTGAAPNWMSAFGPLPSPAHDVVYVFVAGPDVQGSITPTASSYSFAMYLIPGCAESGTEPQPIGATATVGHGIDLLASGVISGNTYYLAITGVASGGGGANGTVNFTTPASFVVPEEP
jgi:hypothetical protein